MVDMLLYDDASWASLKKQTKAFKDWEDKWLKAKNAKSKKLKEDRERLEFELLRGALGNCNSDDYDTGAGSCAHVILPSQVMSSPEA